MVVKTLMVINGHGEVGYTPSELESALRKRPDARMDLIFCTEPDKYNQSVAETYSELEQLNQWIPCEHDINWHKARQQKFFMPNEYKDIDIAAILISRCNTTEELERMATELFMYQDRELFPFLNYLYYLVEILKEKQIILGVGRGSSVASFALYKLGLHKIDSLKYGIPIEEFLK